jgi:hypothetical protein
MTTTPLQAGDVVILSIPEVGIQFRGVIHRIYPHEKTGVPCCTFVQIDGNKSMPVHQLKNVPLDRLEHLNDGKEPEKADLAFGLASVLSAAHPISE